MRNPKSYFIKTILWEGKWFFAIPSLIILYFAVNAIYFDNFSSLDFIALLLCLFIMAYTVFFLRPPNNFPEPNDNNIYASADGYIISIEENIDCPYIPNEKFHKVVIFMHVASMHWNLSPIKGEITHESFKKGKFKNAFSADKAWMDNEHQIITIQNKQTGISVVVAMVAGLVARRIRFFAKKNAHLEQGDVMGLIRYGSANVVYLPANFSINVKLKQKSRAGKTVLAIKGV